MADVPRLFDEYAERFLRGERPDAREYLESAGERRDELAALIDRFLARVPPPEPDEDARALAEAWVAGQPPLVELRARRGLRRDEVVDALMDRLALDKQKREKVKRYYHRLEGGLLDASRVDRRVFEVLAETLRAQLGDLLAWRPRPLAFEQQFLRAEEAVRSAPAARAPEPDFEAPREYDEIDVLFLGPSYP